MSKPYKDLKERLLQDPETKREYEALDAEYQIIKALIELRIKYNLTQEDLSKLIGIPKTNISRFENGKHSPTFHTLERFAAGLNKRIEIRLVDID
jgi:DNA-binding XRE family transcriptional regulator